MWCCGVLHCRALPHILNLRNGSRIPDFPAAVSALRCLAPARVWAQERAHSAPIGQQQSAVLQVRAELRRRTAVHAPGSAGLLRALGVAIPPNPGAGALAAAARRALREHHPDRHQAAGLRAQVVAEETFKMISQAVPA